MDLTPIIPGLPRHHSSDPRADDWVNVDDDDDSDDDGGEGVAAILKEETRHIKQRGHTPSGSRTAPSGRRRGKQNTPSCINLASPAARPSVAAPRRSASRAAARRPGTARRPAHDRVGRVDDELAHVPSRAAEWGNAMSAAVASRPR